VDGLDLEIPRGEVFGFLGPNGAGKTTTVRMLACLIASTAGEAWINHHKVGEENTRIRRSIGILTESPGLYDRLSAEKNLEIFARLQEVQRPLRQAQKYLEMLGLWERRHDLAGHFSKGMRQKLALCRALLHEPGILFLDEPTSGLDPEATRLIHDFIRELKSRGRTIFLCTHNLPEADLLCDRIGIMRQRLLVVDSARNLRQQLFGRKIVFHLAGSAAPFLPVLRSFPFVRESRAEELPGGGKIVVTLENPEEQNPALVRSLVEQGASIQFVGEMRHSLEEVYLSLVKQGGKP
jgi:ABC-2 type transport system ATP-binding protein